MTARVWNKNRDRYPPNTKYIGRGSPYGNPFEIGVHGNRDQVCDRFEREILPTLDVTPLVGYDLLCFCRPLRCHGEPIIRKCEAIIEARARVAK
jgi:hypothetical protein